MSIYNLDYRGNLNSNIFLRGRNDYMTPSKVRLSIAGAYYSLITEEDEKYLNQLASEVDKLITTTQKANSNISLTQAGVLAALDFADKAKKATITADHLREQLKDYLDDASSAKNKADSAKIEAENAKRDLENANSEIERLKIEIASLIEKSGKK